MIKFQFKIKFTASLYEKIYKLARKLGLYANCVSFVRMRIIKNESRLHGATNLYRKCSVYIYMAIFA